MFQFFTTHMGSRKVEPDGFADLTASSALDGVEPKDAGSVVVSHADGEEIIVNALFALPPFTPAVDVYENGQMVAGYQFSSLDECRDEL